jgi:hypothetical protein
LDHTALKPKVRLEAMAVLKPSQLKDSSPAEAMATPNCGRTGEGEGVSGDVGLKAEAYLRLPLRLPLVADL